MLVISQILEEIDKLPFRKLWYRMRHNYLDWYDYKREVFRLVNVVREKRGNPRYSDAKLEEMWQYRSFGQDTWKQEREELLNGIFGWW